MAYDVFISHSSKDKLTADAICHALEENGIRCWIAPRDVRPGFSYGAEIIQGIRECSILLVIYSENSNASDHVKNEIERAFGKKIIIPYRIDNAPLDDEMEYFLSRSHWIGAYANDTAFTDRIQDLIQAVRGALCWQPEAPKNGKALGEPPAESMPAVQPALESIKSVSAAGDFFAELDKLKDDGDCLIYLMDIAFMPGRPYWRTYCFFKSGSVRRSSQWAPLDEKVVYNGIAGANNENGTYAVQNGIVSFTVVSGSTDWTGTYRCRPNSDGTLELHGTVNQQSDDSGTLVFAGTYTDGFFNPNANYSALKNGEMPGR